MSHTVPTRDEEDRIERQLDDILKDKDSMFTATLSVAGGDGSFLALVRFNGRKVVGYAYSRPNPEMVGIAHRIAGSLD